MGVRIRIKDIMTSRSHIKRLPSGIYKYPYIYCAWLWVWSAALFAGWTRTSPFASLLAASAFTLVSVGPISRDFKKLYFSGGYLSHPHDRPHESRVSEKFRYFSEKAGGVDEGDGYPAPGQATTQ